MGLTYLDFDVLRCMRPGWQRAEDVDAKRARYRLDRLAGAGRLLVARDGPGDSGDIVYARAGGRAEESGGRVCPHEGELWDYTVRPSLVASHPVAQARPFDLGPPDRTGKVWVVDLATGRTIRDVPAHQLALREDRHALVRSPDEIRTLFMRWAREGRRAAMLWLSLRLQKTHERAAGLYAMAGQACEPEELDGDRVRVLGERSDADGGDTARSGHALLLPEGMQACCAGPDGQGWRVLVSAAERCLPSHVHKEQGRMRAGDEMARYRRASHAAQDGGHGAIALECADRGEADQATRWCAGNHPSLARRGISQASTGREK